MSAMKKIPYPPLLRECVLKEHLSPRQVRNERFILLETLF
jgi:hypothetical protein